MEYIRHVQCQYKRDHTTSSTTLDSIKLKTNARGRLSVCNQQATLCRTAVFDDDWQSVTLWQDQNEDSDLSLIIRWKNQSQRAA